MTDTGSAGDRLDAAIAAVRVKVDEVKAQLGAAGDELSAKVDELQAAWDARQAE